MSNPNPSAAGADWTQLLSDPEVVPHFTELLKLYGDTPADRRETVLLAALREIKQKGADVLDASRFAIGKAANGSGASAIAPPFEAEISTSLWAEDRREHPRLKCFIAAELRVDGASMPIWGNLANASLGGCLVQTPEIVSSGRNLSIGLWMASGQIWVKGIAAKGISTTSNPTVRVKFSDMQMVERETLRNFLQLIQNETKDYSSKYGYLAQIKRESSGNR
jgi:hypothetical protein